MEKYCRICGRTNGAFNRHHVFGASNRKHSETYKLTIDLCPQCHLSIHTNNNLSLIYKKEKQREFENRYGHEKFMQVFGRNYLDSTIEESLNELG